MAGTKGVFEKFNQEEWGKEETGVEERGVTRGKKVI